MIRVTLDSNVYIAALQYGGPAAHILGLARAGIVRIDSSDAILDETIGVLRDRFNWSPYRLHSAWSRLTALANMVEPKTVVVLVDSRHLLPREIHHRDFRITMNGAHPESFRRRALYAEFRPVSPVVAPAVPYSR